MNGLMNGYVAILNVIAAVGLIVLAGFAWIVVPIAAAIGVSIFSAVLFPLPIYAAIINFRSYREQN
jgi:hypothetical protein